MYNEYNLYPKNNNDQSTCLASSNFAGDCELLYYEKCDTNDNNKMEPSKA